MIPNTGILEFFIYAIDLVIYFYTNIKLFVKNAMIVVVTNKKIHYY